MVDGLLSLPSGTKVMLLAPFIKDQKGEHKHIFEQIKKAGFARVRVDGTVMDLNEAQNLRLDKQKKHIIDVVVDRLTIQAEDRSRVSESLEKALDLGDQIAMAFVEHREARFEALGDVIGVQNCDFRRLGEPGPSHGCDIGPRNRQDTCAAPGST